MSNYIDPTRAAILNRVNQPPKFNVPTRKTVAAAAAKSLEDIAYEIVAKNTMGNVCELPPRTQTNTKTKAGGGASAYASGGGGGGNVNAQLPAVNKIDWQNKSIDEMASILGLTNYKYEDILRLYNNATNKKFDEIDTQTKRAQADNLRTLEDQYDTYLNTLRQDRANAVSNGITKGASAAMQLATMYGNAQVISEKQQALNDILFDLAQQRGTALEENALTANKDRQAIEQYLGTLRGTYEANSVNELAARLAANSQVEAARLQADATTKAAGISANGSVNAARAGATAAQDKVLQYYIDASGGDYYKGVTNYLNQLERDSRSNESLIKYQIANKK